MYYYGSHLSVKLQLLVGASPATPKLRAPRRTDELTHSRRPSVPLPMAPPKLARAALSKLAHGRSRLSRQVSPGTPSSMLLLRSDDLSHGLRQSLLPTGSTESCPLQHSTSSPMVAAANLDEITKGRIRCVPGRGLLRAKRNMPSRLLKPYCDCEGMRTAA